MISILFLFILLLASVLFSSIPFINSNIFQLCHVHFKASFLDIFVAEFFREVYFFCPVIEISTGVLILIHCSRSNHRNTIKVNDIYFFVVFFVIALICHVSSQQEICPISQACKEPTPSK